MLKKHIPKILIVAGCLCIVAAIAYEAATYPWSTVNNDYITAEDLPDPTPPDFNYVDYASLRQNKNNEDAKTPEMPSFDETTAPSPQSNIKGLAVASLGISSMTTIIDALESDVYVEEAADPGDDDTAMILLGYIKIPRINVSINIFEGADNKSFYNGAGHVEGTSLPDEKGNVVLAAHRVSPTFMPFRYLNLMREGDLITIKFCGDIYTYEVFDVFIVAKEDVWILDAQDNEPNLLTLVTCDPVSGFNSGRPNRLVVWARLIEVHPDEV